MRRRRLVSVIGIRPGEKLHEVLISEDEARNTIEREHMFIVKPPETLWERSLQYDGQPLPDGFRYSSDNNQDWLDVPGIQKLIEPFEKLFARGKVAGMNGHAGSRPVGNPRTFALSDGSHRQALR